MCEIKNLIFKLVEKKPISVSIDEYSTYFTYSDGITLTCYNDDEFSYSLFIDSTVFTGTFTEKEFMKIKWKAEDWENVINNEAIEKLKDFVDTPNGTMDDLLND